MFPFEYYIPTKIIFGEGTVDKLGEITLPFGKKVLLVTYDEKIVKSLGFYNKALNSLKKAGIKVIPFLE